MDRRIGFQPRGRPYPPGAFDPHTHTTHTTHTHPQNNPVFLQTYGDAAPAPGDDDASAPDATLRYHYAVHCSLDAVEERREC